MRDKFSKIALAAILGFALAFTFSCSSGGGDNDSLVSSSSGGAVSSSSSVVPSSSSSIVSSSSVAVVPSSSSVVPSSTVPSSSSVLVVLSSSSVVPSSSSTVPSSSSVLVVLSSSSVVPSSSSAVPSSSSVVVVPSSSSSPTQSEVVYGASVTYQDETYQTVVIGSQTWMARNLNYAVEGSKCYNDNTANCVTYGRLYNWSTAMALPSSCNSRTCYSQIQSKHRGICPSGWHLPSKEDWDALTAYIESDKSCTYCDAKHLKASSGWNASDWNGGVDGLDSYEFSALPGGLGNSDGDFFYVGDYGLWWSASVYTIGSNYRRYVYYIMEGAFWLDTGNDFLFSVRCLQD